MPLAAVLLPLLAAAAPAPHAKQPIVVTGHAWAPFISPMGEPFRARTPDDDTLGRWFVQADSDRDGVLSPAEMLADADRFFATLDSNHDRQIDPDELVHYEWEIAPDIQLMSKTRPPPGQQKPKDQPLLHGLQGAARYALLNMPEPVAAADANFDRSISQAEFRAAAIARFQLLDGEDTGGLGIQALQARRLAILTDRRRKAGDDVPDARIGTPLPAED